MAPPYKPREVFVTSAAGYPAKCISEAIRKAHKKSVGATIHIPATATDKPTQHNEISTQPLK